LIHNVLRYLLLLAVVASTVHGIVNFRGSNLTSPRYVTRPDSRWWSAFWFFSDDEWTADGLVYRRRLLTWWVISAAVLILLVQIW